MRGQPKIVGICACGSHCRLIPAHGLDVNYLTGVSSGTLVMPRHQEGTGRIYRYPWSSFRPCIGSGLVPYKTEKP